jgi:hypothetical protein
MVGLPVGWENVTTREVILTSKADAKLVDHTDEEKAASKFIQIHDIKYNFDVVEEARDYYGWREIITDIGGIYIAASKVLEAAGLYFMIQYFWWLGGTKKRLAGYQLDMNAINNMKSQMKDAKNSNKDLSSEIDKILDTDIHEYGYRQTKEFRE